MDAGAHGELIANVLFNYTDKFFFEADNRLAQKAHSVINGSLEYRPTPNWGIEVYGKNLTDRHYYASATSGSTGDQGQLAPPRIYGVNLKAEF